MRDRHASVPRAPDDLRRLMSDRFARTADRLARLQDARADGSPTAFERSSAGWGARSTSAPAPARSRSHSLRSPTRSSPSTSSPRSSQRRGVAPRPTSSSSRATPRSSRSRTGRSTWRERCACSITSSVRSGLSPSSTRVTRRGGTVLVVDQLAPADVDAADRAEPLRAGARRVDRARADRRGAPSSLRRQRPRAADVRGRPRAARARAVPRPRRLRGRRTGACAGTRAAALRRRARLVRAHQALRRAARSARARG